MATRARRTDSNHRDILDALQGAPGVEVYDTHEWPGGLDALVGFRGVLHWLEIKDGAKPPSARKLTPAEAATIARFRAIGCPVAVVTSVDDALRAIGAI